MRYTIAIYLSKVYFCHCINNKIYFCLPGCCCIFSNIIEGNAETQFCCIGKQYSISYQSYSSWTTCEMQYKRGIWFGSCEKEGYEGMYCSTEKFQFLNTKNVFNFCQIWHY